MNSTEHSRLGNSCRDEGRYEEAIPEYLSAIELAPDFAEVQYKI